MKPAIIVTPVKLSNVAIQLVGRASRRNNESDELDLDGRSVA